MGYTDRFSTYVLSSKDEPLKASFGGNVVKTGDILSIWFMVILGTISLLALAVVLFLAVKRRA